MTTTSIEPPVVAESTEKSKPNSKPKAMIIDDAFDKEVFVEVEKYIAFSQHLEEISKIKLINDVTGLTPITHDDARDNPAEYKKFINTLFSSRSKNEELQKLTDENLFDEIISRQSDLHEICKNIESQEFEIERLDSQSDGIDLIKEGNFKIIFLDYNLGPNPGELAVKNAREKARSLYEQCPEESKPIIILMSSNENVGEKLEQFKRDLGIGTIVFRATQKDNLINDGTASLLIQAYKNESEHIHKLQSYITELKSAANVALYEFQKGVDELTIDDYAFIHNTTVMDQAHPLGDYLGWLYGSHWTNLLLKQPKLKIEKDALDHLLLAKPALHHTMPSSHILEIYMSALFEIAVDDITPHSMAGASLAGKKEVAELPHLHLGDILLDKTNQTHVWMILNPQCDLERLTEDMSKNSILLVPGELSSLSFEKDNNQKTELIIIEGKEYRIIWKLKKVISIPVSDFFQWKQDQNLTRDFILRLPYALEVQQAFTSIISRVGLPVPPPISSPIHIQVWIKRASEFSLLIEHKKKYGFRAVTRNPSNAVRLTVDFAIDFIKGLFSELEKIEEHSNGKSGTEKIPLASKKVIDELLSKFNEWYIRETKVDAIGKRKILIGGLEATENLLKIENKNLPQILINFVTDEEANNLAASAFTASVTAESTETLQSEEVVSESKEEENESKSLENEVPKSESTDKNISPPIGEKNK